MTSGRHKNPNGTKLTCQDQKSTCPCVHSKWPHYSSPAAFLKINLPRKRMKYIHVTIYNFPLQTNWKRYVKIIFLNFTYLSFGFHAAMLNRKRKDDKNHRLSKPHQFTTIIYGHILSSEITHSVTTWISECYSASMTDLNQGNIMFAITSEPWWLLKISRDFCLLLVVQASWVLKTATTSVHMLYV
jgi:hypothetical protein